MAGKLEIRDRSAEPALGEGVVNLTAAAKALELLSKLPPLWTTTVGFFAGYGFFEMFAKQHFEAIGGFVRCSPDVLGICLSEEQCVVLGGAIGLVVGAVMWVVSQLKSTAARSLGR